MPGPAQAGSAAGAPAAARGAGPQLGELELREDLFDDFCVAPWQGQELEARLAHLFWRTGRGTRPELVEYGPLILNLETYQAALPGRPLDLTYMEYELLKFLATHPGKVFTREVLLSRVWGYEYYGGARTVDVHIRRLRAKLGEEHANLISTVRSVGYRFGQSRWVGFVGRRAREAVHRAAAVHASLARQHALARQRVTNDGRCADRSAAACPMRPRLRSRPARRAAGRPPPPPSGPGDGRRRRRRRPRSSAGSRPCRSGTPWS